MEQVQNGKLSVEEAKEQLATFENLGFAKVDHHRKKRQGFSAEIIFGEGKTAEQIISISEALRSKNNQVLITRISKEKAEIVQKSCPDFIYNETAQILYWKDHKEAESNSKGYIAVICAGTSDLRVAEEAAVTAEVLGSKVHRIYDVGVAGIHRLLNSFRGNSTCYSISCSRWNGRGSSKCCRWTCFTSRYCCPDKRWIWCEFQWLISITHHVKFMCFRDKCCQYR